MAIEITGPAGRIEAHYELASNEKTVTAVLCHPHPQYGGSMHDAVLDTAAKAYSAAGINCMRFNFRGVGASAGSYDGQGGEVEDLRAVVAWVREEYPRDKLHLMGYSFGAHIVWQALAHEQCKASRALLVAPPVGMMPFSTPEQLFTNQVDALAGTEDDFVKAEALAQWPDRCPQVTVHTLPGADHFFAGHHEGLGQSISELLSSPS